MESVDKAVRDRYSKASEAKEVSLCCPIDYNPEYLKIIPKEVIDRDYGCGDPSAHVHQGETVLDLGSGGGKICFIAAQKVGLKGQVIGVDINDEMLSLAHRAKAEVTASMGYDNLSFRKGKIQDLKTDRQLVDSYLKENPVTSEAELKKLEDYIERIKVEKPLVADGAVDVVVSNCVLNLVDNGLKKQLFSEIFRVLKKGGRAVISDIVCDEPVPEHMQQDETLWSGCISGAFQEAEFLKAFTDEGFYGVKILARDETPWQTVEGIEFRSMTVVAYKGKEGPCFEHNEAVVYNGPFSQVVDDDGHVLTRGERVAVCRKTYEIYKGPAYREHFSFIEPRVAIDPADAKPFTCTVGSVVRDPKDTKGPGYDATIEASESSGCC